MMQREDQMVMFLLKSCLDSHLKIRGTVEAAKWLHKRVNHRNVYIKIPTTTKCIPSIKQVISLGISVNVTVSSLFSLLKVCFILPS